MQKTYRICKVLRCVLLQAMEKYNIYVVAEQLEEGSERKEIIT